MRQRRPALVLGELLVPVFVVVFLSGLLVFAVGKLQTQSQRARARTSCPVEVRPGTLVSTGRLPS
jgi:hypothetical protein